MSEEKKVYTPDLLQSKSKEELIQLIIMLQEEVAMLDFLVGEYESMQEAMGKAIEKGMVEHLKNTPLSNTETGEA
tara:strand:+ start:913 stop:1137 length:225 start_codon:yes stop_codon:yes gene_type:complete